MIDVKKAKHIQHSTKKFGRNKTNIEQFLLLHDLNALITVTTNFIKREIQERFW
jgi:hypothetical protein